MSVLFGPVVLVVFNLSFPFCTLLPYPPRSNLHNIMLNVSLIVERAIMLTVVCHKADKIFVDHCYYMEVFVELLTFKNIQKYTHPITACQKT